MPASILQVLAQRATFGVLVGFIAFWVVGTSSGLLRNLDGLGAVAAVALPAFVVGLAAARWSAVALSAAGVSILLTPIDGVRGSNAEAALAVLIFVGMSAVFIAVGVAASRLRPRVWTRTMSIRAAMLTVIVAAVALLGHLAYESSGPDPSAKEVAAALGETSVGSGREVACRGAGEGWRCKTLSDRGTRSEFRVAVERDGSFTIGGEYGQRPLRMCCIR